MCIFCVTLVQTFKIVSYIRDLLRLWTVAFNNTWTFESHILKTCSVCVWRVACTCSPFCLLDLNFRTFFEKLSIIWSVVYVYKKKSPKHMATICSFEVIYTKFNIHKIRLYVASTCLECKLESIRNSIGMWRRGREKYFMLRYVTI